MDTINRKAKLEELIRDRFGGSSAEFARAIGRKETQVYQWTHDLRGIGEKMARHIEQKCRLPKLWMDQAPQKSEVNLLKVLADIDTLPEAERSALVDLLQALKDGRISVDAFVPLVAALAGNKLSP